MLALYQNMLGLIVKLARSFGSRGEIEDLGQEGYIALCNAVRAYRPEEGTPFASYAAYWIRQGMGRYLENCGRPIRIPAGRRRAVICKYRDGLKNELVERLGITGKEAGRLVDKGLREFRKPERLDRIRPYLDGWRYSSGMKGTGAETFKRTWTSATERTALRYVR